MTTDLVKSLSIQALLMQRDACVDKVQQALVLLDEARAIAKAGHMRFPELEMGTTYCDDRNPLGIRHLDVCTRRIDAGAWDWLFQESGMRTFMSSRARREWSDTIQNATCPPLTGDAIEATFTSLHENRGAMAEQGVIDVFRALSFDYKTNRPMKFGTKLILRRGYSSGPFPTLPWSAENQLADLVRCFYLADGRPEPDHRDRWTGGLEVRGQNPGNDGVAAENDYLRVRGYPQAGTLHLRFKRADLVEQLNRILAKHFPDALPAAV